MPKMTFIERDGTRREVDAPLGLTVLEIARRHAVDIEVACEGSLACSTCHVIVDQQWYELLNEASEDEEDMLDLAFNLTLTSRLGCQIIITEELDGLTVQLILDSDYFRGRVCEAFRRAAEEGLFLDGQSLHVGLRGPIYAASDLTEDAELGFRCVHAMELERIGVDGVVGRIRERAAGGGNDGRCGLGGRAARGAGCRRRET